jgi:hypothetical protein
MLERGDQVPHFAVTMLHGTRTDYSEIWQRRNLLLVCLPAEAPAEVIRGYASHSLREYMRWRDRTPRVSSHRTASQMFHVQVFWLRIDGVGSADVTSLAWTHSV